eukprot:CAMPEP_0202904096 /NCGR_PEP_ID=MMETSP1392-20130828/27862_1 /ASSEMBLY_ACC=CAM_ASM_000868 /TAXON_ID=225041 /ORGANISM="Chlamydomonas chlamydogama, Strain SAG 11-48b" /LENGTH=31 /DNA_ID= /DNA_START= /DNA_END= /DNA_ORIENTATION=
MYAVQFRARTGTLPYELKGRGAQCSKGPTDW